MSRLIIFIIAVVLLAFAAVSCTSPSARQAQEFDRHLIRMVQYHEHNPTDVIKHQATAVQELRSCLTLREYHALSTRARAEEIHKIMYNE